jgi:hypothetical protein
MSEGDAVRSLVEALVAGLRSLAGVREQAALATLERLAGEVRHV